MPCSTIMYIPCNCNANAVHVPIETRMLEDLQAAAEEFFQGEWPGLDGCNGSGPPEPDGRCLGIERKMNDDMG